MSTSLAAPAVADEGREAERLAARRLQVVIGGLASGLLLEDEHRRIVQTNDAFCALFGIPATPAQMLGVDCAATAEQSKQLFADPDAFVARVDELLAAREPVIGETVRLADGRVVERDYQPVWIDGIYRGHLWKYRDISDQVRESEKIERLKSFYEQVLGAMPAQLAVFDTNLRYRYVTPSAIANAETRRWIIGHSDVEYAVHRGLDPAIGEQRMTSLRRVLETGEAQSFEESFADRAGVLRTFMRYVSPVRGLTGEIVQILGYGIDITAIRKAQGEMIAARDVAERAVADRERFLATMSHEIRTPLNAILGTAHLLPTTSLSDQQREYVAAIRLSAEGLLRIINDILDFARINSGEVAFEAQPFRPRDVIDGIVASLRFTAERKEIGLAAEVDPNLPAGFIGDAGRLHQILLNLVANSIKFTEHGGVTVRAEHEVSEDGASSLVLSVIDSGAGIAPERCARIFDPFVQERSDTARRFGGTGLGLAIVKEFVERQGGTVTVESRVGVGSTFRVRLPMAIADLSPVREASVHSDEGPRLHGVRVLVAEDNPLNQVVVSHLLQHAGATVVMASTGREAVEILRRDRAFGCVLMDVQMPEMDGFAATRAIRTELGIQATALPILALTASVMLERREEAAEAGMNGFIVKPFRPADLRTQIKRQLPRSPSLTPVLLGGTLPTLEETPLVERRLLLGLTMGDLPFASKILLMFLRDCPTQLDRIQELGRAGEHEALSAAAHRLRSGAGTVGAMRLHAALGAVEVHANDPVRLRAALPALARAATHTLVAVRAWQRELPPPEADDEATAQAA